MFNSISGIITEKSADTILMETGGIEWEIAVPGTDLSLFPPEGETSRIFTWLSHKEDHMKLFGFSSEKRRATFLELLKVDGIGPKGALKIMGGIGQEELETALENEDLGRLEAVPGLGKKTAQKMLLALKGKLAFSKDTSRGQHSELTEALVEMGYDKRQATEALKHAETTLPEDLKGNEREQELFKHAIIFLAGN